MWSSYTCSIAWWNMFWIRCLGSLRLLCAAAVFHLFLPLGFSWTSSLLLRAWERISLNPSILPLSQLFLALIYWWHVYSWGRMAQLAQWLSVPRREVFGCCYTSGVPTSCFHEYKATMFIEACVIISAWQWLCRASTGYGLSHHRHLGSFDWRCWGFYWYLIFE